MDIGKSVRNNVITSKFGPSRQFVNDLIKELLNEPEYYSLRISMFNSKIITIKHLIYGSLWDLLTNYSVKWN